MITTLQHRFALSRKGASDFCKGVLFTTLRTIAQAGRVVVLDGGRVKENGTPGELVARRGLFARMVERQMGQGQKQ